MAQHLHKSELNGLIKVYETISPHTGVVVLGGPVAPIVQCLVERFSPPSIDAVMHEAADRELATAPEIRVWPSIEDIPAPIETALWRPSGYEGKVHQHRIARHLAMRMEADSQLLLLTHKRRGASALERLLDETFAKVELVYRHGSGARIFLAANPHALPEPAADLEESVISAEVGGRAFRFVTVPSLFSKERLDAGTRFLLETILPVPERRILDLGCGYGPVGVILAALSEDARVVLVDKDPRAVHTASRNVELSGLTDRVEVVLSDGCQALGRKEFDLVVSHFPLHISSHQLVRILAEARERMVRDGRLVGVALEAYDVRPSITRAFGNVRTLARSTTESGGSTYRVVEAIKTRQG